MYVHLSKGLAADIVNMIFILIGSSITKIDHHAAFLLFRWKILLICFDCSDKVWHILI